jgi:hypothetical protein
MKAFANTAWPKCYAARNVLVLPHIIYLSIMLMLL